MAHTAIAIKNRNLPGFADREDIDRMSPRPNHVITPSFCKVPAIILNNSESIWPAWEKKNRKQKWNTLEPTNHIPAEKHNWDSILERTQKKGKCLIHRKYMRFSICCLHDMNYAGLIFSLETNKLILLQYYKKIYFTNVWPDQKQQKKRKLYRIHGTTFNISHNYMFYLNQIIVAKIKGNKT